MEPETIHDLSAGYALHALDADDERRFEEHLDGCERCRDELASLREAAARLAYAEAGPPPPVALRSRILDQVQSEKATVIPFRPRRATRVLGAVAAAAAALAIGVGIWAASLRGDLREQRSLAAVLADPAARSIPLRGADGRVVVTETGEAALVADVDPAPPGRTYEIWVIERDDPKPAGLFEGGRRAIRLSRGVPAGATVAVTVERDGGVDKPTSHPVFSAET